MRLDRVTVAPERVAVAPERVAVALDRDFRAVTAPASAQEAYQPDNPDDRRQGEGGRTCELKDRHLLGHTPQ
ncbi:hypothetical protein ACIPC1_28650 [Streptomyces sp. NPDC087263]|uniref:hypothetical protein n=1 Tax=Streptomyces sp. NPDC087263 TaxID=3365773 RepID=UPI00381B06A6